MANVSGAYPQAIDGSRISVVVVDATTDSGDHTIVSVASDRKIKVYAVQISPDADITGDVVLKVGSTEIGKIRDPVTGGNHFIYTSKPHYYMGALDEDLVLNTGSATDITVTAVYEVVE